MLQAFAADDLSTESPDFSRLNNAIVAASRRGGAWIKLADDWNVNVFEKRAVLAVLPPVWASTLNNYWERYAKLYIADAKAAGKLPAGIPDPFSITPGGFTSALRDFYAPLISEIQQAVAISPAQAQPLPPEACGPV